VVRHVRDALGLAGDVELERPVERTAKRYRELVRSRMKVTYDAARVRQVAEQAIRKAVQAKGNPAGCSPLATFGGRGQQRTGRSPSKAQPRARTGRRPASR
jgi:hypothetical protein